MIDLVVEYTARGTPAKESQSTRLFRYVALYIGPLTCALYIDVGGQIFMGEVILLACLPILLVHRKAVAGILPNGLLMLAFIWMLGLTLSFVANHSSLPALLKAVAGIVFLLTSLYTLMLGLAAESDYGRRLSLVSRVLVLFAIGLIIGFVLQPTPGAEVNPWKFGYGIPVTLVVAALDWRGIGPKPIRVGVYVALAAIHLLNDFRSLAGISLLLAALVIFSGRRSAERKMAARKKGKTPVKTLLLAGVVALVSLGATNLYVYLVRSGALGQAALMRYDSQVGDSRGLLGLLLGGRKEYFFYANILKENWLLGAGPAPDLTPKLVYASFSEIVQAGYQVLGADFNHFRVGTPVPLHSMIFGSWVEAGLMGLPFWLALLWISLSFFMKDSERQVPVFVLFLSILLIWNILFSPFGSTARFLLAVSLSAITVLRERSEIDP